LNIVTTTLDTCARKLQRMVGSQKLSAILYFYNNLFQIKSINDIILR
jgi:hypothetical protein